jgi:hypothetical protein
MAGVARLEVETRTNESRQGPVHEHNANRFTLCFGDKHEST